MVQQGTLQLAAAVSLTPLAEYSAGSVSGGTAINLGSGGAAMNGTIVGGVTVSADANHSGAGPALSFDGNSGSYIDIPSGITNLGSGQNWTISGWFETSTPGTLALGKRQRERRLGIRPGGILLEHWR